MSSPASSGPAGSHFEGQVGAHYLLSMLTGSEPRGLPGTTFNRVEFQRAPEGRPLDDVIVQAHDSQGRPAVLEIQIKRGITFAPSDKVFRSVMSQIAAASRKPDFWNSRYELGIAIARTSHKIDSSYQDVLTWARQLGDAATFTDRINRPGSANDDMRTFLNTFRSHLRDSGAAADNETVWGLLRRLQILVFDFTAQGSVSEELAKERAIRALHSDEASRSSDLWVTLIELALQIAQAGADRTRLRLIDDLRQRSFRLAGDRCFASARPVLAESSRHALADISDRVGNVMLTRHERVAAVHAALDEGRYVEIRGDAGVGKSGVLKHFAAQISAEAQVVVLSPGRTTPRGWMAMRAMLEFDGTSREFLSDLAGDGGAVLFVDNLDFFTEEERRTVVDLVREAAGVPGVSVIATARRDFGVGEPSWLPSDALDQLGRATPVIIDELNLTEIDELRDAAAGLVALLAEDHPARGVTRNLFRLARLANRSPGAPILRTEIDMAEQWWQTADGKLDDGQRDRARLLKFLAVRALLPSEAYDVSDRPPGAVDALVASETLRDLGNDRVAFRHDVLREWAIANVLFSDPEMIERLPLTRPAPAALARGLELSARMALERTPDSSRWRSVLAVVSREGAHGSWRRAAMLALVRSEVGFELLNRASTDLLADRAQLLRELIRTVMAVDVEQASKRLAAIGVAPGTLSVDFDMPSGLAWPRLIYWLANLGADVPAAAIPEVVAFYTTWSKGMFGQDPITPGLLKWLHYWLIQIENDREGRGIANRLGAFSAQFDHRQLGALESDLRNGFLLFCNRTPELAASYLRSLRRLRYNDDAVRSIMRFRGALAQAAPKELAELTSAALVLSPRSGERDRDRAIEGPFGYMEVQFVPVSPAQGPFYELLVHAPEHGLMLVRRLVDHAISFYTSGRPHGSGALTLPYLDGERQFAWVRTYSWPREGGATACVTSALMALEAWGHSRIDAGEPFEKVLSDILDPAGVSAAYLAVAVDLVLSHWPKSREAAIPFLACPELLCLDRKRLAHDSFEYPDILGLKSVLKEPVGAATLDTLKRRPSRRLSLYDFLGRIAVGGPAELRNRLTELLHRAATRLGPPNEQSDLGDPAFMTIHALNLLDRKHWREVPLTEADGSVTTVLQYSSPAQESKHFDALQDADRDRQADTRMKMALMSALSDPARSSPQLASEAIDWAKRTSSQCAESETGDSWMREEAVVIAAMIAARDGTAELRAEHEPWMRAVFVRALRSQEDSAHRFRSGLHFNPIAIAFVGMSHLLKDRATPSDILAILAAASMDNPAASHGFAVAASTLADFDEHLPRAVLRCAFAARVCPSRAWNLPEEVYSERCEHRRQEVQAAVDAEVAWLTGAQPEPAWPNFPLASAQPRQRSWEGPGPARTPPPEERTDHQGAALWLSGGAALFNVARRPWLRDLIRAYMPWTVAANGAGLERDDRVEHPPMEWNAAFFNLLAYCLPGAASEDVDEFALAPIESLPDEPFFDAATQFVRSVDAVYFGDSGLEATQAVRIRSVLARRLTASRGWERLRGDRSTSIEWHIAPAIAALFFNDYDAIQGPKCYLLPKGSDRIDSFLPVLQQLVQSGPHVFVALVTLNLFEVSPRLMHLPFIIAATEAWMESYPNNRAFWIDHEIGQRLCSWIDTLVNLDPRAFATGRSRTDVDRLLAALVRLGVPQAHRLEEALRVVR